MAKGKNITPTYDLVLNQGEDARIQLQICDVIDDAETPENIEDYTFVCRVREEAGDSNFVLNSTFTILDKLHGIVELYFKADDTDVLTLDGTCYGEMNQYTYDVFLKDKRGDEQRILCGNCYISPSVSNR